MGFLTFPNFPRHSQNNERDLVCVCYICFVHFYPVVKVIYDSHEKFSDENANLREFKGKIILKWENSVYLYFYVVRGVNFELRFIYIFCFALYSYQRLKMGECTPKMKSSSLIL